MEAVVTLSINSNSPSQVSPQDVSVGQGGAAASNPDAGSTEANEAAPVGPSQADQIAAHAGLVAQASQAVQSSASSGVDPNLNDEGARLAALQLRQQLSGQNLSIANQAPQALLSLLR
jgi:flagellin